MDQGYPVLTARDGEHGGPGHRTDWRQFTLPNDALVRQSIQYRTVLRNELVFDLDYRSWPNVKRYGDRLLRVIEEEEVPEESWFLTDSAGKGIHIHIFYDTQHLEQLYGFQQMRALLWEYFCRKAGIHTSGKGGWLGKFDVSMHHWGDNTQGRLVRLIGGKKVRYKAIMDEIPAEQKQHEIYFPEKIQPWTVPPKIWDQLGLDSSKIRYCSDCPGPPAEYPMVFNQSEWFGCLRCAVQPGSIRPDPPRARPPRDNITPFGKTMCPECGSITDVSVHHCPGPPTIEELNEGLRI